MKKNLLRSALLLCLCTVFSTAACSDSKTEDPEKPDDKKLTAITITPASASLVVDGTVTLTATPTPAEASLEHLRWSTESNDIVAVNATTGNITAKAVGTAVVKATCDGVQNTCEITVTAKPVDLLGITVDPSGLTLKSGETADVKAGFIPANATVTEDVVWSIVDPTIASVDASGKVTAKKAGRTQLTAAVGEIKGTCGIEVYEDEAARSFTFYQLNIWEGLNNISNGLQAYIDQLVALQPDAASFCEFPSTGSAESILSAAVKALKERTGIQYYYTYRGGSGTRGLLTRHPILSTDPVPSANGDSQWFYRTIIDYYGQEIALYASHAFHEYYACYLPRGYGDGKAPYGWAEIYKDGFNASSLGIVNDMLKPITDVDFILEREELSGRTQIAKDLVADAAKQNTAGRLAIFGGDLNQPSHLDWTESTKDMFEHRGCVVPWPISKTVYDGGMKDAFRTIYPDPVTHPGVTWPVYNANANKETKWAEAGDERDRIDFVYYYPSANLTPTKAQMVGPAQMKAASKVERVMENNQIKTKITDKIEEDAFVNKAEELISPTNDKWPTDHRGLLITFEVKFPGAK